MGTRIAYKKNPVSGYYLLINSNCKLCLTQTAATYQPHTFVVQDNRGLKPKPGFKQGHLFPSNAYNTSMDACTMTAVRAVTANAM